jgi:hypothetical protein
MNAHRSPASRWLAGADAFARGEIPPADPDAAEGWYYAENAAARFRTASPLPRYAVPVARAVSWSLVAALAGSAALAVFVAAQAIAFLLPGSL